MLYRLHINNVFHSSTVACRVPCQYGQRLSGSLAEIIVSCSPTILSLGHHHLWRQWCHNLCRHSWQHLPQLDSHLEFQEWVWTVGNLWQRAFPVVIQNTPRNLWYRRPSCLYIDWLPRAFWCRLHWEQLLDTRWRVLWLLKVQPLQRMRQKGEHY